MGYQVGNWCTAKYSMLGNTNGARAEEMKEVGRRIILVGLLEMGEGSVAIQ